MSEEARPLAADEVYRRGFASAAMLGLRGLLMRAVAFGGMVGIARLLTPSDFGAVSVGAALVVALGLLADGGVAAGLIGRTSPPGREELAAALGFQLCVMASLGAVAAACVLPFGRVGLLASVMLLSLPISAFRTPAVVLLERELSYGRLATAEVGETLVYYLWALVALALGAGVWALVSATVVRAVIGTALVVRGQPCPVLRPRLDVARIRPLVRFGSRYAAVDIVGAGRDQGLALGIAGIAGTAELGLWSLAARLFQLPFLIWEILGRLLYPLFSRLIDAGEQPARVVERTLALTAAGTGLLVTLLVGGSPGLIPLLFGRSWEGAVQVFPWAAGAIMLGSPLTAVASSYLLAVDDADTVLRATVLHTAVYACVALPLLAVVGLRGVAAGWVVAACVDALVVGRRVAGATGARVWRVLARPGLGAWLASVAGWLVARSLASPAAAAAVGAALAEALFLGGLLAASPRDLVELASAVGRMLRLAPVRQA